MSEHADPPATEIVNTELLEKDATAEPTPAKEGAAATEADIAEIASATENGDSRAPADLEPKDTNMSDVPATELPEATSGPPSSIAGAVPSSSVRPADSISNVHSPGPAPARTGTITNGIIESDRTTSRAVSVNPEAASTFTMPSDAADHGAPTRQYINSKITGPLLEGMKMVARERPKDPLRVLGEYLLQRSKELEGTAATAEV